MMNPANEGRCAVRASCITIALEGGSVVDDEQHFLLYLTQLLGDNSFCVWRGECCTVEYMLDTVSFTVLDGIHPPGMRELLDTFDEKELTVMADVGGPIECPIEEVGFLAWRLTEFKLHKEQSDEVHPTVFGYEAELQPLFERIEQVFLETSSKSKEASSSSKHTTFLNPHTPLKASLDDEQFLELLASCNINAHFLNLDSKSELTPSSSSNKYSNSELSVSSSTNQQSKPESTAYSKKSSKSELLTASSSREPRAEPRLTSRGVLVTAPSGCGKTLLLDQLRHSFTSVLFGRPVTNLSTLFELAAAKSPCLVLFDNLDTLEHNKKIQPFLNDLPAGVLVVATATNTSHVPTDLRQPTALGIDLVLAKPGAAARRAIIAAMLEDVQLKCDASSMQALVSCSAAATGRELNQLVEGLAVEAAEPVLTAADVSKAVTAYKAAMQTAASDTPTEALVTKAAAPAARSSIKVIGYEKELERLDGCFELTLQHADVYAKMNLSPPSRILLFGPTGCGKTWLVRAMAVKYSLAVRTVTRADVFGKYFGESEKNLNDAFDKAIAAVPCILHLPSFDGLASVRSSGQHEVEHRVVNLLKARMDGALKLKGLIIVAETSRPDLLDSAIVRRGRIKAYLHVGLPSLATRRLLAQHWLEGAGATDAACRDLAHRTEGYTVAEVQEVCREYQESGCEDLEGSVVAVQPGTTMKLLKKLAHFKTTYQGDDE